MLGEHDKYTLESLSALNIVQEEVRLCHMAPAFQHTTGSQGPILGKLIKP